MSVTYMTRQQRAVLEGVKASPEGCATAAELAEQLHREGQTIGLTTVYRQLERLDLSTRPSPTRALTTSTAVTTRAAAFC